MKKRLFFFFVLLSLFLAKTTSILAQDFFPEIKKISINDNNFKQLSYEIQAAYQSKSQNQRPPTLHFYQYTVKQNDDFYKLSAALSVAPYTLATLNGIEAPSALKVGTKLFIPNRQGIFVPNFNPNNFFLAFIVLTRLEQLDSAKKVILNGKEWFFLENEQFLSTEYAYFLKILYRYPLDEWVLTSSFGKRIDPFTNRYSYHRGIDLAAPFGANVYASNDGVVLNCSKTPIYGNYITLSHSNNYETLYAHLSKIIVKAGDKVVSGQKIGEVGTTGKSTGPHLHFEIRRDGKAIEPTQLIKGDKKSTKN